MNSPTDQKSRLLPVIAAFKICKALLLFVVAFGFHHLLGGNAEAILEGWMKVARIDTDNRLVVGLISKITGMPTHRLHQLEIGTFFYGLMFGVEGVGLLLKKRWAEYLTVVTTATFLPIEIYELVAIPHRKVEKAILLLINVAILAYLLFNLYQARRQQRESSVS